MNKARPRTRFSAADSELTVGVLGTLHLFRQARLTLKRRPDPLSGGLPRSPFFKRNLPREETGKNTTSDTSAFVPIQEPRCRG